MRKLVWISYLHLLPESLHISKPHLNPSLLLLRAPTPYRHSHPSLSTSRQIYSPVFQLAARGTRNNHKKGCHETSSQVLKIQALDTSLYAWRASAEGNLNSGSKGLCTRDQISKKCKCNYLFFPPHKNMQDNSCSTRLLVHTCNSLLLLLPLQY